jgi:hypothetical protein
MRWAVLLLPIKTPMSSTSDEERSRNRPRQFYNSICPAIRPIPIEKSMASELQNVILMIALTGGALLTTEER